MAKKKPASKGGAKPSALPHFDVSEKTKKPSLWHRFRSAISGLFVSKQYAEANPDTTVREKE